MEDECINKKSIVNMQSRKVSVIIPMYNVEKYIKQCASSLFEQTYNNMEYIFVDDCSTDKTLNVLEYTLAEYPTRKKQTIIIKNGNNIGVAATRNKGLKTATGDIIAWCDADDWLEKDTYEMLVQKMLDNNCDVVISDFNEIGETQTSTHIKVLSTNVDNILISYLKKPSASLWSIIAARSLYIDNRLEFINGCDLCEDINMAGKILFYARKIIYVNIPYYNYRSISNSISHRIFSKTQNLAGLKNTEDLLEFYINHGAEKKLLKAMAYRIQVRKRFYLYEEKDIQSYCSIQEWVNKYILFNHMYGLKTKFVESSICFLFFLQMRILKLKC